jgi:pilus assembly protein CpaD
MKRPGKTIVGRSARPVVHVAAVAGLAAMLGGCYQSTGVAQHTPYPFDYRERHPITLREGDRTVEIFVGRNRGGLTPAQRADVLAFAQQWRREGTSGVMIDVPKAGPSARAAADSMREVHAILNASGVPAKAVYIRGYRPAPAALASIKLRYAKLTAEAGPCGQWPHDIGPSLDGNDFENRPYWNLGCATQRNLAAMVDNPADLVQPRGEAPVYESRRSVAIDKYRRGVDPSGTYSKLYDQGRISDVGK